MCGIVGLVDPTRSQREVLPLLKKMTDVLLHRGPDDEGFYARDGLGLGMRRLSIIDVAGGHQPISNEDGSVQVVLNGEIYNYLELKASLKKKGHHFRTQSDTEVIAHLYEDSGVSCLHDLRGMFGLAIWDQKANRLVVARDRLGKKPVFYASLGERLFWGSEIKSILVANPDLVEMRRDGLISYFRYGFVPEPRTMYRRILKLPAAHYLLYEQGRVRIEPYWSLDFSQKPVKKPKVWAEELDAHLEEAVRIRLRSDVPLGVFLSGGLDSSAIVSYAHRLGLSPLKTFTIGFDRAKWDESADAKVVADHFQTEHHVLRLSERDLMSRLPETVLKLVDHFDEPFGDPSALPTFCISQLAREHVKVILSGDGGDELFAGYTTNQGIRFAGYYGQLPSWLGRRSIPWLLRWAGRSLPGKLRYGALRAGKVISDGMLPFDRMYLSKIALCTDGQVEELLTNDVFDNRTEFQRDVLDVLHSELSVVDKLSYADIRIRLLEDMLVKVDRMSMAHSLEVRSPLLDHKLVELVAQMPHKLKLRRWQSKAILRDVVGPSLPASTLKKRKQGFAVPLREWLKGGLKEMVWDYLDSGNALPEGVVNKRFVRKVLNQHYKSEADHSSLIWLLLNFAGWNERYFQGNIR